MSITDDARAKHVEQMLTPELQRLAKMIEGELPEGWGFGLIIFPFSRTPGEPLLWVSNAKRDDMIETMREYVERRGG